METICIAEDNEIDQRIFKWTIAKHFSAKSVLYFNNGGALLNYLIRNRNDSTNLPDLIFLDLNMPVLNGWDFLNEFVKIKDLLCKYITIYIVTNSIDPKEIIKAKEFHFVKDFLTKPLSKEKLGVILGKALS